MVGSAICRALERNGYTNIITRTHKELDLCRQDAVEEFFRKGKAGLCIPGSSEGRRHHCEQRSTGGFHV